ncbi:energy-coupling factor transporter transmembrane component T family protein [Mangrovibacterium lignilyticum]|uniref:energy-coupling factor transporter transmembrane component T family protein n=1 Tax=Mangrovibacterium lignilyticum TaxID=2668052 RepID=UPI0013D85520|nr:CbiQ family ECF transporter T component [Mangrovibacterium lignilyticum]
MWITEIYKHNHRLQQLSPAVRALYWAPAMVLALVSSSVYFNWAMFALVNICLLEISRVGMSNLTRLYRIPVAFILIGCFVIVLEIPAQKAFITIAQLPIGLSTDGLQLASLLLSRSLALISILYFILLTNTISEIAELMRKCRIPALFIDLFVITFKFIENLRHTSFEMYRAQKCRLGYSGNGKRIPLFAGLMAAVFHQSMQNAKLLETAMQARCAGENYCFLQNERQFVPSQLIIPASFVSAATLLLLICCNYGW